MKIVFHRYAVIMYTIAIFLIPSISIAAVLNDYNPWDVQIPDNGTAANSDLNLSGALSGSKITNVKIYYEITHSRPSDLDVWLTCYDNGWQGDYFLHTLGSSTRVDSVTVDNIHTWDGQSPNVTWYLVARDSVSGRVGYINFFELWITYEVNNTPLSLNGRISYHSYSNYLAAPVDSIDGNVFIYNLNTTINHNLTGSLPVQNCMNPHFSPDGSKIAFMAIPDDATIDYFSLELYVYDLAEMTLLRLTQNSIADEDPKFSSDGNMIVYKRDGQVWSMNADGTSAQQITTTIDEKSGPNYSFDGSKIVYWSDIESYADIWWMDSNGSNPSKIIGVFGLQEYYPNFRDSNRILYTRWESMSDYHDKIYQYTIDTAQNERLQINITGVEDSDPFPVSSTLIGFSSQRSGGKGGWDVYIGESANATYYTISQINSLHQDLGGTYSPFRFARKLKMISPASGVNIETGSIYLVEVRTYSDGAIWAGANPSVLFLGPVAAYTYTGLKDDGTGGDQSSGDGIFSKTVTLPLISGSYSVTANALSSDNGLDNYLTSEGISINLYEAIGSLRTIITPQEAIDTGAQWRVDGSSWYNSGYMYSDLSVGSHTVEFKDVPGWTKPSDQIVTVIVDQTTTLSAVYSKQIEHNLIVNIDGPGDVTLDPDGGIYYLNTVVTLTATADPGWVFGDWSGDLISSDNLETIVMNSNKNVTLTFLEDSDYDGISDREEVAGLKGKDENVDTAGGGGGCFIDTTTLQFATRPLY